LIPACPFEFNPHAYNIPVVVMAKLCAEPAAILLQLVVAGPDTSTGELTVTTEEIPT
jgi:hypothetical protein